MNSGFLGYLRQQSNMGNSPASSQRNNASWDLVIDLCLTFGAGECAEVITRSSAEVSD